MLSFLRCLQHSLNPGSVTLEMETELSSNSLEETLTTRCGKQQMNIVSNKTQLIFDFLTSESFSAVEYSD